jgi:hypothetical protein
MKTVYTQPPETYVIGGSKPARKNFAKNLNKLLAWADVKLITAKDLF